MVARVPAGHASGAPVTVPVTVENEGGAATSPQPFRVLPNPVFVDPQFAPEAGTTGDRITLSGQNLNVAGLQVTFGGVAAPVWSGRPPRPARWSPSRPVRCRPLANKTQTINLTVGAPGLPTDTSAYKPFTTAGPVPVPTTDRVHAQQGPRGRRDRHHRHRLQPAPCPGAVRPDAGGRTRVPGHPDAGQRGGAGRSHPRAVPLTVRTKGGDATIAATCSTIIA